MPYEVGQVVAIEHAPRFGRGKADAPEEATVTKVARKYVTVRAGPREYQFEIATGKARADKDGFRPNAKLHVSMDGLRRRLHVEERWAREVYGRMTMEAPEGITSHQIDQLKAILGLHG